jgi:hypothetical protein
MKNITLNIDSNFTIKEIELHASSNIAKECSYNKHVNENIVKKYFEDKGYFVIPLGTLLSRRMVLRKLAEKNPEVEFPPDIGLAEKYMSPKDMILLRRIRGFCEFFGGEGIPDLFIVNKSTNEWFFCEVKGEDKLRNSQIMFIFLTKHLFNLCEVKLIRVKIINSIQNFTISGEKNLDIPIKNLIQKTTESISSHYNWFKDQIKMFEDKISQSNSNKRIKETTVTKYEKKLLILKAQENYNNYQIMNKTVAKNMINTSDFLLLNESRKQLSKFYNETEKRRKDEIKNLIKILGIMNDRNFIKLMKFVKSKYKIKNRRTMKPLFLYLRENYKLTWYDAWGVLLQLRKSGKLGNW